MCVYKLHSAQVTSETLAGYQMVLRGAHRVAACHENTQHNGSDLYGSDVTGLKALRQLVQPINSVISLNIENEVKFLLIALFFYDCKLSTGAALLINLLIIFSIKLLVILDIQFNVTEG